MLHTGEKYGIVAAAADYWGHVGHGAEHNHIMASAITTFIIVYVVVEGSRFVHRWLTARARAKQDNNTIARANTLRVQLYGDIKAPKPSLN